MTSNYPRKPTLTIPDPWLWCTQTDLGYTIHASLKNARTRIGWVMSVHGPVQEKTQAPEDYVIYQWRDGEWHVHTLIRKGTRYADLPWRRAKKTPDALRGESASG